MSANDEEGSASMAIALAAAIAFFVVAFVILVGTIFFRDNEMFDRIFVECTRRCCGDGLYIHVLNVFLSLVLVAFGVLLLTGSIPVRKTLVTGGGRLLRAKYEQAR